MASDDCVRDCVPALLIDIDVPAREPDGEARREIRGRRTTEPGPPGLGAAMVRPFRCVGQWMGTSGGAIQRSELNAARSSVVKSSGSSQAAKWPPRSTSLK
jgi:hypothetical protein